MNLSPEQKGQRAQRILEDEVYQEAIERAKSTIKKKWEKATSREQREALWHKLNAIDAVNEALVAMKGDGQMQRHHRERQEKQRG